MAFKTWLTVPSLLCPVVWGVLLPTGIGHLASYPNFKEQKTIIDLSDIRLVLCTGIHLQLYCSLRWLWPHLMLFVWTSNAKKMYTQPSNSHKKDFTQKNSQLVYEIPSNSQISQKIPSDSKKFFGISWNVLGFSVWFFFDLEFLRIPGNSKSLPFNLGIPSSNLPWKITPFIPRNS